MLISENNTENLFYVKYRYSDGSSLPATGDIVTVDGVFDGNYKKSSRQKMPNLFHLHLLKTIKKIPTPQIQQAMILPPKSLMLL